ncbi:MAG TPA: histidine phosphatase family protein [Clostridiales bacterium]|nr:histidine phosphatase family protein [Clostridiales bacterium]
MYAIRAHRVVTYIEQNFPKDATILLVSHFSYLRYLISAFLNLPADPIFHYGQNNSSLSLLSIEEEDGKTKRWIQYLNDLSHLYQTEFMTHREY